MSKIFMRSSCQEASDETDDAHRWRCGTRSGRAKSACHFRGRPHKAARRKLRWTERERVDCRAEAYGFFIWDFACRPGKHRCERVRVT